MDGKWNEFNYKVVNELIEFVLCICCASDSGHRPYIIIHNDSFKTEYRINVYLIVI